MKKIYGENNATELRDSLFLLCFILLFLPLTVLVMVFSREETHMWLNTKHCALLDELMKYWTLLGDGRILLIISLLLLLFNYRLALISFASFFAGGMIAQVLKLVFFKGMARPVKYFELQELNFKLHLVEGVDLHNWYSFPSGHTATAFAVFFALSLSTRQRLIQIILFILAAGVGYSRVYLSQHFLTDITGGAIIGMLSGWLMFKLISHWKRIPASGNLLQVIKK